MRNDDGGVPADFVMALRFFSRLPAGRAPHRPPNLDRMAPILPFASLVIGLGPAALMLVLAWLGLPAGVAAVIGTLAMVIVTGAMADDALADAADGLFGGRDPQHRLEIMRDSRHGTYGVLAIVGFFALRVFAYAALLSHGALDGGALMLAAFVLGRSGGLWVARLSPARLDGAAATAGRANPLPLAVGLGVAMTLTLILGAPFVGHAGWMAAFVIALLAVGGWSLMCRRLVSGQTGDLIGAGMAICESAALIGFLLFA